MSPGFPANYPPQIQCVWNINVIKQNKFFNGACTQNIKFVFSPNFFLLIHLYGLSQVPEGKHIIINFIRFSLTAPGQSADNCTKDYLEVNHNR